MIALQNTTALQAAVPKTYTNVKWLHFVRHYIHSNCVLYSILTIALCSSPISLAFNVVSLKLLCKYLHFRRNKTIA